MRSRGRKPILEIRPDVSIIDINLPDLSGFELLRRIRKENPAAKVIMFSTNDEPAFVVRAIELGANGYVSKSDDPEAASHRRQNRCRRLELRGAAPGPSRHVCNGIDPRQSCVAAVAAGTRNPAASYRAAGPSARSQTIMRHFLQDGGEQHHAPEAEAGRAQPFRSDPVCGGARPYLGSSAPYRKNSSFAASNSVRAAWQTEDLGSRQ